MGSLTTSTDSLSIVNEHPQILDGPKFVHDLINWREHSKSCALDFLLEDGRRCTYTYHELWNCVVALAAELSNTQDASARNGSSSQAVIAILLPQCPALYIAILAILNVHAAYCPITIDSPIDRIKFVVGDVSADIVITTKNLRSVATWENGPRVVVLDEAPTSVAVSKQDCSSNGSIDMNEHDLAYVMYTSGSTGKPKGVALSHLAVSQSLLAHDRHIPRFTRFLQFAAPSFDVCQFEILFTFYRGATLVGCYRQKLLNDLPGVLNELNVDAAELTPTVAGSLLQTRSAAPCLKTLLTIGEMLTQPVVDEFGGSETQESMLYAMYGPTEAAIHCTVHPNMKAGSRVSNIGVVFDTVSAYIISIDEEANATDRRNEPRILALNELGELVLGGVQLASGYLNRPEQNAAAFISINGSPAYRTGDKARMLADGSLEVFGRISSGQVKIRGQRAELGEIEAAVYKHQNVKMAVASVFDGSPVVFALQRVSGTQPSEIIDTCRKWLPKFMIPNEIVLLKQFPYLPSGKVDKKQLERDYQAARLAEFDDAGVIATPTERKIMSILLMELGFKLRKYERLALQGVDSLLAIRIASVLRKSGLTISSLDVLRAETLDELAVMCDEVQVEVSSSSPELDSSRELRVKILQSLQELERQNFEMVMPCTALQDAMLGETQRNPEAYANKIVLEVSTLHREVVKQAIDKLVRCTPILRSSFVLSANADSHYVRVVWSEAQIFVSDDGEESKASPSRPFRVRIEEKKAAVLLHVDIHHALYDGWSLELLLDDLDTILDNQKPPHRPSFGRIVEACQGHSFALTSKTCAYWKDHLSQFEPRELPSFHSCHNAPAGLQIASRDTTIPTAKLQATANTFGLSSQSLIQAAYCSILSSYLGTNDVAFGTVFSGRTAAIDGIEDIVGPCLATLPVRIDLDTVFTAREVAEHIHSVNRRHLENSEVSLRDVRTAVGIDPGVSLFDTLVIWQQTLHSADHKRNNVRLVDSTDYLEFSLTLEITPKSENLHFRANYQNSVFSALQINLFLDQLEDVVRAMLESPERSLTSITTAIQDKSLSIDNPEPQTQILSRSLTANIEQMAVQQPDKIAVEFATAINREVASSQTLSYKDLNERANQIAHYLVSIGARFDDLVCVCMEKSPLLYATILAVVKAGAAYLPLTPATPGERIRQILRDADVGIVLTESTAGERFTHLSNVKVAYVDELRFTDFPKRDLLRLPKMDNLAYSISTSGSTGKPKGVLVTQGNLLSNIEVLSDLYPHNESTRLLQSCSQAFDVSVFEIFFTWHVGGCLCAAVNDVLFRDIEMAIRALRVTHLSLTPTVAALVDPNNVPAVGFLVTAGEPLSQRVFNLWAGPKLYQGYGPSETTNICTIRRMLDRSDRINCIGTGFRNVSTFVLASGKDFKIVPRGGEGEFCFGGPQIGRGYLNPKDMVDRFIDHPQYGRLYRSGDYGRMLPDGSLLFTGRQDGQVKIRGLRIELGEIDACMLSHDEVTESVTLGIEQGEAQRLVTFWVHKDDRNVEFATVEKEKHIQTIRKLFSIIESRLPAYMAPSVLLPVTCLPATSQGKVDKRLLVQTFHDLHIDLLSQEQSDAAADDHQWTEVERSLADAISQVSKAPRSAIGPHTSLFSLGIDSISAISLSKELKDRGMNTQISDILKYSTVSRLAKITQPLESAVKTTAPHSTNETTTANGLHGRNLEPSSWPKLQFFDQNFIHNVMSSVDQDEHSVEAVLPCTPLQEAMLSSIQGRGSQSYINHTLLRLKVTQEEFHAAWAGLVKRQQILRTGFLPTEHATHAFVQIVFNTHEPIIQNESTPDVRQTVEHLRNTIHFDVDNGRPPHAITFISARSHLYVLLSIHHSLYDGYAMSVLYEELEQMLKGESLPAAVPFAPFLQHIDRVNVEAADRYWANVFSSFRSVAVPQSQHRALMDNAFVQQIQAELKYSWVQKQTQSFETSLLAVCQTVWSSLLATHLHTADVCFGNVVSGRSVPVEGVERLAAPCFNTIPVRSKNLTRLSYLDGFRALQAQIAESLPFQFTPLRRIQTKCSPEGRPLFHTLLILQPPARELDQRIWTISQENGAMDVPIVIEITPNAVADSIELLLHSSPEFMSKDEAKALLRRFDQALARALTNPRHQILSAEVKATVASKALLRQKEERASLEAAEGLARPLSHLERMIQDVFAMFCDVPKEKIYLTTTIFRLGLDSINALQIASALRKRDVAINASDILQYPTIKQLAVHLERSVSPTTKVVSLFDFDAFDQRLLESICIKFGVSAEDVEAIRPCTVVQAGMLAQTLHSNGRDYANSFCMKLAHGTSLDKLQMAWNAVAQRHELLRTAFACIEDDDYPFAMVSFVAEGEVDLPWFDVEDATVDVNLAQIAPDFTKGVEQWPWKLEILRSDDGDIIKFTGHHALYDAQSLEIILSEVAQHYQTGKIDPEEPPLIEPLLSAILLAGQEDSVTAAVRAFWSEENKVVVNKFPELTPLYEDSPQSSITTRLFSLSMATLEQRCRESDISVQSAAQAAWAKLLSFYTGESTTTFGVTLSGRSIIDGAEDIAFPTIVTLPLSIEVSGKNSDVLKRSACLNAQLLKHQFSPLTQIQKLAGHPEGKMFDTLFAYQKNSRAGHDVVRPWTIVDEQASVDYAVSIELEPQDDNSLQLRLTTKDRIVPQAQAFMMLEQYETVLRDLLEMPQASSTSLKVLKTNDLFSITPAVEPVLNTNINLLHELVERQAKLTPNGIALEFVSKISPFTNQTWTYAELNAQGNRVAHLIQKHGIGQGEFIGICFEKCAEASFAILGILKAGCAYVAIDPNAPADRVKFILDDAKSSMVISGGKPAVSFVNSRLPKKIEVIDLTIPEILDDCSSGEVVLVRRVDPQETSYCLYTSGTTGTPKGCLLTHENAVQALLGFTRLFDGTWNENSRWLTVASWHFDVSVLEQYWSWSVGIRVMCTPRDLLFEDIPHAIRRLKITHIVLTPSLARLVHPDDVPSLWNGVFITGGEKLKQEILDVWGEKGCMYNAYGPTETTIGCMVYCNMPVNMKPANIGPAFANVGSYVLKPGTNEPVFRGAVGELCITGKLVGKGYLNRPEKTAESFPFIEDFEETIYRTGDLVRILHDNTFLFLGRADDQVKLRGQRIQLSEGVEVMKKNVSGLDEVVTLVLRHAKHQKEQLVTFFVPKRGQRSSSKDFISALRNACKSHLPPYMVPTYFVPLQATPLSANNKADSKQLSALYDSISIEDLRQMNLETDTSRAWSAVEAEAITALAKAIGIEEDSLSAGTTIFELGVDSISIIRVSRALQRAGYPSAQLSALMTAPSIDTIVRLLTSSTSANDCSRSAVVAAKQQIAAFNHKHKIHVAHELGVDVDVIEALAPCTASQEGLIYRFLDSSTNLYYNEFNFRLDKKVDLNKLKAAWGRLAQGIQMLRTKFVLTSDGCAQVVLRAGSVSEKMAENKNGVLASSWHVEHRVVDDHLEMRLSMLHAIFDGVSLPLLLEKLSMLYNEQADIDFGPSFLSMLPHGPLAKLSGAEEFWGNALANLEYTPLPKVGFGQQQDNVTIYATRIISVDGVFQNLQRKLGVTHQAVVQAAWASVLQEYLTPEVAFGLVVSGRSFDSEADKVIGPLLNTIVFQRTIKKGMSWTKLIKTCHDFNVATLPYQHTALKDIQKWCGAPGQSLFDTLFAFRREDQDEHNCSLWEQLPTQPVADYPLIFDAQLNLDGGLTTNIFGQSDYINDEMANRLLEDVEGAFTAMANPESKIPVASAARGRSRSSRRIRTDATIGEKRPEPFEWTPNAAVIREEITALAGMTNVNAHVSLFELGLDSIDMIKLSSRLKKKGLSLSVSTIVRSQTIAKMVFELSATSSAESHDQEETSEDYDSRLEEYLRDRALFPDDTICVLPATALQEGMVAEMIQSNYSRYFNHAAYRVKQGVDLEKLRGAWASIFAAHGILRTTFVEIDAVDLPFSYAQIVHDSRLEWEIVHSASADINVSIQQEIENAVTAARNGQLFRLCELKASEDSYFLLSISHALYDGYSIQALHADVWSAYHDIRVNRPQPQETLKHLARQANSAAMNFWRSCLSGLPESRFPQKSNAISEVHKQERSSNLPLSEVQDFCRSHAIGLQTLGQTCWALLLATYQQSLDIAFGAVLSCRDTDQARELMFPLMNTVVVRSVLHGTIADMLSYMQTNDQEIRQYQDFPLRKAQALAGHSEGNLFDTLFIYQGQQEQSNITKRPLYKDVTSVSEVEFPVCVEMQLVNDELVWRTACKDSARSSAETTALINDLDHILAFMVQNINHQVIESKDNMLSICGMQPFPDKTASPQRSSRKSLQSPSSTETPWSESESKIRSVLSQVSQIPEKEITKQQTIFHLGLDSILAIKISSILKRQGVLLSVADIMRQKTIQRMAIHADEKTIDDTESDTDAVIANSLKGVDRNSIIANSGYMESNVEDILPVSAGQLYTLARWQVSGATTFGFKFEYELPKIDILQLEDAWAALVQHHTILRTVFVEASKAGKAPVQLILKSKQTKVLWESGPGEVLVTPSDPVVLCARDTHKTTSLTLHIHHALYDAISLPMLISDLEMLLPDSKAKLQRQSHKDFVARTLDKKGGHHEKRQQFWQKYIGHVEKQSPRTPKFSQRQFASFRPSIDIGEISSVAQRQGLSTDALILACISKLYKAYPKVNHKESEVLLGMYLSNRAEFPTLAAPTLNMLPLSIRNDAGAVEKLAQVVQDDIESISHPSVINTSLKDIYEWTGATVDIFVNILKAIDSDETEPKGSAAGKKINVTNKSDDIVRKERSEVLEITPRQDVLDNVENWMSAAYPVSHA